jgi:hypothetical protein
MKADKMARAADIEHGKVIAGHGSPTPFLRKGSPDELRAAIGATKLPALKLPDGTVITHSRAILSWISQQKCSGGAGRRRSYFGSAEARRSPRLSRCATRHVRTAKFMGGTGPERAC